MTSVPNPPDPDPDATEPSFEDVVAALLKVDPEGITGQTAGKGRSPRTTRATTPSPTVGRYSSRASGRVKIMPGLHGPPPSIQRMM